MVLALLPTLELLPTALAWGTDPSSDHGQQVPSSPQAKEAEGGPWRARGLLLGSFTFLEKFDEDRGVDSPPGRAQAEAGYL